MGEIREGDAVKNFVEIIAALAEVERLLRETNNEAEIAVNRKRTAFLNEREFYDVCQSYRHAKDINAAAPGLPTAHEAFEALKAYVRSKVTL